MDPLKALHAAMLDALLNCLAPLTDQQARDAGIYEALKQYRVYKGCSRAETQLMLGPASDPVPATWFRDFLATAGLSAPAVSRMLKLPDDRKARRWKSGEEVPPWGVCELLAAWYDGRAPELGVAPGRDAGGGTTTVLPQDGG